MKIVHLFIISIFVLFLVVSLSSAQEDAEGSKDTPYFSRMPNFFIWESGDKEFDTYQFYNGKELVTVEGIKYYKHYCIKEGAAQPSNIQIRRNYINAIKSMGGVVLFEGQSDKFDDDRASVKLVTGKVTKGNRELWIEVWPDWGEEGQGYHLTVLEKEAMKQDVTASDMLKALDAEGRVALYINFDVDKTTIKPESKPIIDQIVAMLKDNPSLKISIEGHTDSTGAPKRNKTLSEQRAKAVYDGIVQQGIDSKRLNSVGWGQEKPIADNKTEEGRAKNRRVELLKK